MILTLRPDRMAHGGAAVARHEGQVVFVRGAIPGETVTARVTGTRRKGRYLTADVMEVQVASPDRVAPPCPLAGECGGCDWQHLSVARQRAEKAAILAEQLRRLGGVDVPVQVAGLDADGLHWRTRLRLAAGADGRWGLRRAASHEIVPVASCPVAVPVIDDGLATARPGRAGRELLLAAQADGPVAVPLPQRRPPEVVEHVAGREFRLPATSFWQAHTAAPAALCAAVAPHVAGATVWWDLYCGVGLFAGVLAGPDQQVTAVEGDRGSAEAAAANLADLPGVRVFAGDVAAWIPVAESRPEVVVLDPPRSGAGRAVLTALTATTAARLVYVACDPAALGRDTGILRDLGWECQSVAGFDLFPMTHHVEAVAVFRRDPRPPID